MYYSAGTYEAFAHPEKPKDVDIVVCANAHINNHNAHIE